MRPVSSSNLSFGDSSEELGEPQAVYERLGTGSTIPASWKAGSSVATAQSLELPSASRSLGEATLPDEAFATARSAAAPTDRSSGVVSPTSQRQLPQRSGQYSVESVDTADRDSPLPPRTLTATKAAQPLRSRGMPSSLSMSTLPPVHDDRTSRSESPRSATVTPVLSPAPDASNAGSRPLLPRLLLPASTQPLLQLEPPPSSSSSELSSDRLVAVSTSSPLVLGPSSPVAGKAVGRQVSFSAPRGDASASSNPTSPNTTHVPPLAVLPSTEPTERRPSAVATAGPSSPPKRRSSGSTSSVHVPTRRFTLAPEPTQPNSPKKEATRNETPSASQNVNGGAATATVVPAAATGGASSPPVGGKPNRTDESTNGGGLRGWYEATKRGVYSRTERINQYLDALIDPIGGGAASSASPTQDTARGASGEGDNGVEVEPSVLDLIGGVSSPRRHGLLFDPATEDHHPYGADNDRGAPQRLVEHVMLANSHEPITTQGPMAHLVEMDSVDLDDDGLTDVDAEQPTFEIDLISAFHGYLSNPNECFGHLVAAALTSRSRDRPVTGVEIREAHRNPYLVRLVLSYSWLDFEDPIATAEVQATLDLMLDECNPDVSPALYEYLVVFFRPPFICLSHRQYTILKQSGFEYVVLLYHNRHVLPRVRFHSIVFNYSTFVRVCNLVAMLISSAAMILHNVSMLLVLANWMIENDSSHQRFGFFTLIVYGCGYAVNLVMLIFLMRTRQDTFLFDESADPSSRSDMPSPYVMVVPVLPIFDVLCVVQYVCAWRNDRVVAMHNVLVSSRLSSMCFSIVFGMAQFIAQSYFYHTLDSPDYDLHSGWHYALLAVTSIAQWGIALFRFAWMMLSYDSVTGLGFTRFNIPYQKSILERHSAVVHILHYLMVFVLENNIYLLVASALTRSDYPGCAFLPNVVISLASASIVYCLCVYGVLVLTPGTAAKVSFSCIPLALLQVSEFVITIIRYNPDCTAYERRVMHRGFIFGYIHWCGYIAAFVLWLLWLVWWMAYRLCNTNLYPRLSGPWKREAHVIEADVKPVGSVHTSDGSRGGERAPSGETNP